MPVQRSRTDAYAVLDVEPTAGRREIRRAFRRTLHEAAPDSVSGVLLAAAILADPELRARYDTLFERASKAGVALPLSLPMPRAKPAKLGPVPSSGAGSASNGPLGVVVLAAVGLTIGLVVFLVDGSPTRRDAGWSPGTQPYAPSYRPYVPPPPLPLPTYEPLPLPRTVLPRWEARSWPDAGGAEGVRQRADGARRRSRDASTGNRPGRRDPAGSRWDPRDAGLWSPPDASVWSLPRRVPDAGLLLPAAGFPDPTGALPDAPSGRSRQPLSTPDAGLPSRDPLVPADP